MVQVPNDFNEVIASAHNDITPYVNGQIEESDYKAKVEEFKEINEKLKELYHTISKSIEYDKVW